MKKLFVTLAFCITVITSVVYLVACQPTNPVQQEETAVYVTVDSKIMPDWEGKTLKDYMNVLAEKKYLTYKMEGTLLVSINDLTANSNETGWWLIYSNDTENVNGDWGKYEKDGVTYLSTTLGMDSLPIKDGVTYLFMISKF